MEQNSSSVNVNNNTKSDSLCSPLTFCWPSTDEIYANVPKKELKEPLTFVSYKGVELL